MSREKQIDEKHELSESIYMSGHGLDRKDSDDIAEQLYHEGYRKQSEGHWFILEYEYFTCSECGYYHPNGCDSTREAKEKLANGIVPKYCSECGAKMGGGAE